MQSIGETLRMARESRGITLDQAEDDTKIRKRYLQALEDEDYDIIPGLVYAKGFLRNYASYLGLNHEEIMIQYKLLTAPVREEGPKEDIRETISRRRAANRSNKRTYMATAIVALLVMGIIAVYGVIVSDTDETPVSTANNKAAAGSTQGGGGTKPFPASDKTVNSPANSGNKPENSSGSDNNNSSAGGVANNSPTGGVVNTGTAVNSNNAENGTAGNPADTTVEIPAGEKVVVTLSGRDAACWTKVTVDGRVVFSGQINPGETKSFSGTEKVKFRLGNAGAVEVNVNGQQLGALGPIGKVVDKEYFSQQPTNNG